MRLTVHKMILVVVAHPDDEVLTCGGTLHRLIRDGHTVSILTLGTGIDSRYTEEEAPAASEEREALRVSAIAAHRRLGVGSSIFHEFPDNRFDTVALLDLARSIEEVVERLGPDLVFTHHPSDLNVDHRRTVEAVMVATRPQPGRPVSAVYGGQALSSTEWAFGISPAFDPRLFIELTEEDARAKLEALECYPGEVRRAPHPRSLQIVGMGLSWWGSRVGVQLAEPFTVLREVLPLA